MERGTLYVVYVLFVFSCVNEVCAFERVRDARSFQFFTKRRGGMTSRVAVELGWRIKPNPCMSVLYTVSINVLFVLNKSRAVLDVGAGVTRVCDGR